MRSSQWRDENLGRERILKQFQTAVDSQGTRSDRCVAFLVEAGRQSTCSTVEKAEDWFWVSLSHTRVKGSNSEVERKAHWLVILPKLLIA